jgi:hypothetical protein
MDKYTLFKCIISGTIGLGVGAAITYYLEEQKIQKVVDSIYEELYAEENAELEPKVEDDGDESDEIIAVNPTDVQLYNEVAQKAGYTKYGDKSDERDIPTNLKRDLSDEEVDRAETEAPAEPSDIDKRPFFIDADDAGNEGFEVTTLVYYAGDGTLATEDDELIDDPRSLVGEDVIAVFESDQNLQTLYVRNREKEIDYEIIRAAYSFSETQGL